MCIYKTRFDLRVSVCSISECPEVIQLPHVDQIADVFNFLHIIFTMTTPVTTVGRDDTSNRITTKITCLLADSYLMGL